MTGKRSRFSVSGALTAGISQALEHGTGHAGQMHFELVPIARIDTDPENPRQLALSREDLPIIDPADPAFERKSGELERLKGLAASIGKHGVQHPIVVYRERDRFRIAMGERRFLASIVAGQSQIPARIWAKRPDEHELRLLQYVENAERVDLSAWERVQNVRALVNTYQAQHNEILTATRLSEITGFALSQASLYMHLVNAPADVQDALASGRLANLDKAAIIAKLPSAAEREKAMEAVEGGAGLQALRRQTAPAPEPVRSQPKVKAAGRPMSRITLGATRNTAAVRRVIETVAESLGAKDEFAEVDWKDMNSASQAWAKLWQRLEAMN